MLQPPHSKLTPQDLGDFRRLAGVMLPAEPTLGVPGADDDQIFDDVVGSLGQDAAAVVEALATLRALSGGAFLKLDDAAAEATALAMLDRRGPVMEALGRVVLQCYYRDSRVMRALGQEPRPPFPKGHKLEQGDFTLLDVVRARPRMWRDLDGVRA